MDVDRANVPCGDCHLCCGKEAVAMLLPEELGQGKWETEMLAGTLTIIKKKDNGDCWYLGEDGCTIHDDAPIVCRVYDCAAALKMYGWNGSKGKMSRSIRKRARALLKAGYEPEPPPPWLFENIIPTKQII